MIGERFNELLVIERVGIQNQKRTWRCRCDCGNEIVVPTGSLRSGNTKSCGCRRVRVSTKHGGYKSRTYRIWQAMLNRCRLDQYAHYYGGLSVCQRWHDFPAFLADMGDAPEGLSIDRKNNALGYFPDNCRWATQTQQLRNTRRRVEFTHEGKSHSLIEWAEILGMNYERLRGRIRAGRDFEDAIAKH